jgi:predicted lactoylglutathione lyase
MKGNASAGPKEAGGIVFFKTGDLKNIQSFYQDEIGCEVWLDQGGCLIFRYDNLLIGFCQAEQSETEGVITFFFLKKEEVDRCYKQFHHLAESKPKENQRYRIYHFFIRDPDGRLLEFQHFLHPVDWDFSSYT